MPEASRLEDEIKKTYNSANIDLVKSSGGDFRVILNGNLIFDKLNDTKRFPHENETISLIERNI